MCNKTLGLWGSERLPYLEHRSALVIKQLVLPSILYGFGDRTLINFRRNFKAEKRKKSFFQ